MRLPEVLKPNGAKIIYFLFLLIIAPFPYLVFSDTSGQYEVNWIWGFPPLVSWVYDYLPASLQGLNIGIIEISTLKTIYLFIPSYAIFIFLLSCGIGLVVDKIRARYEITTFRGLLWRKLERRSNLLKKLEKPKKVEEKEEPKKEEKPEEKKEEPEEIEEIDKEKLEEMAKLIREEESFLKSQKEKLRKYMDEANIKKLKTMGVDVKENKLLCFSCNRWVKLPKGKLKKLIEKHGFDVIWEYECPDCKRKK